MGGCASKDGKDGAKVEAIVEKPEDIKDGEMREIELGDGKALLVKENGEFHAIGAKCTHYGAPLANGAMCNGRVRCPWHGACFNIRTGDIEDYPGLDSLPKFEVEVKDGKVKVIGRTSQLKSHKRLKAMSCAAADDERTFLLVGGGPASLTCAETLRQEGFKGKIIMVTKDKYLPYDRPKLSKAMNVKVEDIYLRDKDFYSVYDINVQMQKEVTGIDVMLKTVTFKDGTTQNYDKVLLATGAIPRELSSVPGHDLENIHTVRTIDDATTVSQKAQGKNVVIIGTSFIGLETAAYLASTEATASVTVIGSGRSEQPLQHVLGNDIGQLFRKLLEDKGVKFMFKNSPKEFQGSGGKLKTVVLADGTALPADLCVVGIGVSPATEFAKDSGILTTGPGFIEVDKQMKTNKENVFAAGDITTFPLFMVGDVKVNVQHWQMAHQQGRIAGLNMLDMEREIHSVPFFWTVICGKNLRYAGYSAHGVGYDDVEIQGSLEELKFVAFYTKGDKVVAVAGLGYDRLVADVAEMFNAGKTINKDEPKEWLNRI